MRLNLKSRIATLLRPNGKVAFLNRIKENGSFFDVGCGNNSPVKVNSLRPDLKYLGLDIGMYNQKEGFAEYIDQVMFTSAEGFAESIEQFNGQFDGILCAHNLEHCNDYKRVANAMCRALKPNGIMYLAFPCEESIDFPKRTGTLNFYDDSTHLNLIPFEAFKTQLNNNGVEILFATKNHKPKFLAFLGFLFEPISRRNKRCLPHGLTWAYYGFESIKY